MGVTINKIKAQGLMVSDKKIFSRFLTLMVSKFHNEINDLKGQEYIIYTIVTVVSYYYHGNLGFVTHSGVIVKLPSNKG